MHSGIIFGREDGLSSGVSCSLTAQKLRVTVSSWSAVRTGTPLAHLILSVLVVLLTEELSSSLSPWKMGQMGLPLGVTRRICETGVRYKALSRAKSSKSCCPISHSFPGRTQGMTGRTHVGDGGFCCELECGFLTPSVCPSATRWYMFAHIFKCSPHA